VPALHVAEIVSGGCDRTPMELAFRFIVGGLVVSLFAVLGDVFKPKSFAGLFGAAPSVAMGLAQDWGSGGERRRR
jgi:hypothetical protein